MLADVEVPLARATQHGSPPKFAPMAAIVTWLIVVSCIPVYNKRLFTTGFSFPITLSCMQFAIAGSFMSLISLAIHGVRLLRGGPVRKSWCCGPYFVYMLRHTLPIGVLFGLKGGLTNLGLLLVPTATNVLLGSTNIFWTFLFVRLINGESMGPVALVAVMLTIVGDVLTAIPDGQIGGDLDAAALAINLTAPFVGGLTVAALGHAASKLLKPQPGQEVRATSLEVAAFKLCLAALTLLPFCWILEGAHAPTFAHVKHPAGQPFWDALDELSGSMFLLMLGSCGLLCLNHLTLVAIMAYTSPGTVAVVSAVNVVPMWFAATLFSVKIDMTPQKAVGAVLICVGTFCWAWAKSGRRCFWERLVLSGGSPSNLSSATSLSTVR